jgi:transposase-like protein
METNLINLIEKYGNDEKCRHYLEGLKWHDGIKCPRCSSDKISRIRARGQFDCDSCRYQFSVTAGSIFHDSHLPLRKWFLAVYLMCESKKGISANQLKRSLAISYKTAWYLCHRIRKAMQEGNPRLLSDTMHETVNHHAKEYVRGDVHANGIDGFWSLFKRSVVGSYHQISTKHLDSYLDEFEWRLNERDNPNLFRDTLTRLLNSPKMEFRELIEKSA